MDRVKLAAELVRLAKGVLAGYRQTDRELKRLQEAVKSAMVGMDFAWEGAVNQPGAIDRAKAKYDKAVAELNAYIAKKRQSM